MGGLWRPRRRPAARFRAWQGRDSVARRNVFGLQALRPPIPRSVVGPIVAPDRRPRSTPPRRVVRGAGAAVETPANAWRPSRGDAPILQHMAALGVVLADHMIAFDNALGYAEHDFQSRPGGDKMRADLLVMSRSCRIGTCSSSGAW